MTLTLALLTLLHVLVFVYWLGGDLGAFYSSYLLTDEKRATEGRFAAVNILNNCDMAPRTAIILAFPTGLTLVAAKGWLALPEWLLPAVWIVALIWVAIVWYLHLKHGASAGLRKLDLVMRWLTVAGLVGAGAAGLAGLYTAPLFISLKLILLGGAFFLGLMVRAVLPPLGPALAQMRAGGPTPETDRTLRVMLNQQSKPMVVGIWIILLACAFLGIATPT